MRIVILPFKRTIFIVLFSGMAFMAISQDKAANNYLYPDIVESRLYETQWQYNYTLHQKSQTQVHQATDGYKNYLYFKLDKSAQIYLNGKFDQQPWKVKGPKLFFHFRDNDSFLIAKLDGNNLVIEYNSLTGNDAYEYHFSKLDDSIKVFKQPDYLLPEVKIKSKRLTTASGEHTKSLFTKFWEWVFGKPEDEVYKPEPTFINIEVIGGGYFGGIDPPIKNYIQLKTNGQLVREYETAYKGMIKTRKFISRAELEQLIEYIDKKGFFELPSNIECNDPKCVHRINKKPIPIPLRISITYGIKHKVVNIPIYGLDEKNYSYLTYPSIVEQIIDILNRMANRLD